MKTGTVMICLFAALAFTGCKGKNDKIGDTTAKMPDTSVKAPDTAKNSTPAGSGASGAAGTVPGTGTNTSGSTGKPPQDTTAKGAVH